MIKYLKAEIIKIKRTFFKKLIFISPLFFAIYGIIIYQFIPKNSPKYFISMVFNWWPLIFIPLGIGLLSSLISMKEKKSGNYKGIYLYDINKMEIWVSKIIVIALYTFIASIELFIIVIILNKFIGDISASNIQILQAVLICWLVSLVLIPINLFLSTYSGTVLTIIISFIGLIIGVLTAVENYWIAIPWSYSLRLMCPIIGIHPNGTILKKGSYLLESGVIFEGIIVSLLIMLILSYITGVWFSKKEVN